MLDEFDLAIFFLSGELSEFSFPSLIGSIGSLLISTKDFEFSPCFEFIVKQTPVTCFEEIDSFMKEAALFISEGTIGVV